MSTQAEGAAAWQQRYRSDPEWSDPEWSDCSRERHDLIKTGLFAALEARALYTRPAAAPELLDALRWALDAMEARMPHVAEGERFIAARAVVDKAIGDTL